MRRISLSEIFKNTSEKRTKKEKISYLRSQLCKEVILCIQLCYGNFKFALPSGIPPFKTLNLDDPGILYYEIRKMDRFSLEKYPNLAQAKREKLFIEILESITDEDVILLCGIKDGKIPYKGMTEKFFRDAVPEAFET